jgi:hypothetical protein
VLILFITNNQVAGNGRPDSSSNRLRQLPGPSTTGEERTADRREIAVENLKVGEAARIAECDRGARRDGPEPVRAGLEWTASAFGLRHTDRAAPGRPAVLDYSSLGCRERSLPRSRRNNSLTQNLVAAKDKVLSMLYNLTEKSAKIDVFMRLFESLLGTQCAIAVYRENAMLKCSRCRGKLYDSLDNFKPLESKDALASFGSAYVLDEHYKPYKTAKECSEVELKGKIMIIPFKSTKIMDGSEGTPSSPSSPRRKTLYRGTFLFIELSSLNIISSLFMHHDLMEKENLQLPLIFSKMEKELLTKVDSK